MTGLSEPERDELARAARQLLDRESAPGQVRAAVDDPTEAEPGAVLWKQMVELGWTGIHIPEDLGGAGAGYRDLAVILHELGRHLSPAPFLSSAVLASEALMQAPAGDIADRYLAGLASGGIRAAVQFASQPLVLDAAGAGILIAQVGDEVVVIEDFSVELVVMTDRTRRMFKVRPGRPAAVLAGGAEAAALMERVAWVGAIAAAADATAVAERVTELTVEYAKNRVQFGKPIGSFQAVKHHCANMLIALEASRAAVRAAFQALDDPAGDVALAAHVAAAYCGPACSEVCRLAVQVHGGIGFTWEHDCHLYLKRAKLDEMLFGTPLSHRRHLARRVFPAIAPAWEGRLPEP